MSTDPSYAAVKPLGDGYIHRDGKTWFRIENSHALPEFFMSLVGVSDHWMFVSSDGALTAGRRDPDNALFPYAADDQIRAARAGTGPITLIREAGTVDVWHPFAAQQTNTTSTADFSNSPDSTCCVRNLYKTPLGNELLFEEHSLDRKLTLSYRWVYSETYGFVRSVRLTNMSGSRRRLTVLDGLQNILPYGVSSEFMMRFSNLANAYKSSDLLPDSHMGIFYLSSIPTDRAEPSEGLRATTVWRQGPPVSATLLSTSQLPVFRSGGRLKTESGLRGIAGAYLTEMPIELAGGECVEWHIIAELEQDHRQIVALDQKLKQSTALMEDVQADIANGERSFRRLLASADGLQTTANRRRTVRHLANTVFNIMRGGIPPQGYRVSTADFLSYAAHYNAPVVDQFRPQLDALPDDLSAAELSGSVAALGNLHLTRLAAEYLPLAFSRRHGDPTRPWNRFAIHLRTESGETNLDYQGNWRDIFQNWEALAFSFPEYTGGMICRFLNATSADGYNPYRITRHGIEWEEPTPEDPWANIGYWGDHQIIYLLKLMEWQQRVSPDALNHMLTEGRFVHANIPYRIADYEAIRRDPRNTITFAEEDAERIAERVERLGADGKLLADPSGEILYVSFIEKILTLTLAKLSNLVPDGGIWMNTQRPEWNDANNALVGYGLSAVTACYLHRWCRFLADWLSTLDGSEIQLSAEVAEFLKCIRQSLADFPESPESMSPAERQRRVDGLSEAGSRFRQTLYQSGLSGQQVSVPRSECTALFNEAACALDQTIRHCRREDGLYHAYNLIRFEPDGVNIDHLDEMLEGQVAVLSAGVLPPEEAADLLETMRSSRLYRPNQDSYMLYPDRDLPRFLEKNKVAEDHVASCDLLRQLLEQDTHEIVSRDASGVIRFNGGFRNAADLRSALEKLRASDTRISPQGINQLTDVFEATFDHRRFTGRSGTFFAYEGLGSIYWHMVSKLGLAAAENFFRAVDEGAPAEVCERLRRLYRSVQRGVGAEKTPAEYGAFPTDPYSHTPENAGAKQPGMTGQVKEDFLSRFMELGLHIADGVVHFRPELLDLEELLPQAAELSCVAPDGESVSVTVPEQSVGLTFCQVPVLCTAGSVNEHTIHYADGRSITSPGLRLNSESSRQLFTRSGAVQRVEFRFCPIVPSKN